MAISTGYDYSVRKGLNERGVDNSRIGMNPSTKAVTVDGRDFMQPNKLYNGTSFTNQTGFNNAWSTFNSPQPAAKVQIQPREPVQPQVQAQVQPKAQPQMVPTGQPIRGALNQRGVDNSQIGYNGGMVTVGGRNFMTPTTNINGTAYADQSAIDAAWRGHNQGLMTDQYIYNPQLPQNAYTPQIDSLIANLMSMAQNQQPTDPYGTPEYAAYAAQSGRRAEQGVRAAQESMGGAGFGRSTALGERAQGIQNSETEYLETQVIPQLLAAERDRQQQQFGNLSSLLNPLVGQQGYADNRAQTERANAFNSLGYMNDQDQQAFNNAITESGVTGRYKSPESQALIDQLIGIKQQAETQGITREQRASLSAEADKLRAQLSGMGIDPSVFGANVTANQATGNRGAAGVNTLQGQAQQLDNTQVMAALTGKMPDGTPTTAQQQQELQNLWMVAQQTGTIPDALADMYGIPRGTKTQDALQFAEQMDLQQDQFTRGNYEFDQNYGLAQDDNDRQWVELDHNMNKSTAGGGGYEGMTPNQIYSAITEQYSEPILDQRGQPTGTRITTNPAQREKMFLSIVDAGMTEAQTDQMLSVMGLSKDEINLYMKKHGSGK